MYLNGLIIHHILENSKKVKSKERGSTYGAIIRHTKAAGLIAKCMVRACSHGRMAALTKVRMRTTKNTDMAFTNGKMEESTRDIGARVNSTVWGSTLTKKGKYGMANGITPKFNNGSLFKNTKNYYNQTKKCEIKLLFFGFY